MSRLVRLYPAAWRTRYEEEFVALLVDRPPTGIQVIYIVLSAIRLRMAIQGTPMFGPPSTPALKLADPRP